MNLPITTRQEILEAKKQIWFNFYRISSYNFYKKFHHLVVQNRWNNLIEKTFNNTDAIIVDTHHKSWVDLFLMLYVDKKIEDPICLFRKENYMQLEPGIKRLLCIPYMPEQKLNYVIFKDNRVENQLLWLSYDVELQILVNENIPAHFKNKYYASRCQSLYENKSVRVEKIKDGVYINGQKTFALIQDQWKICLPNLMEEK
jgi:hypothetical protein